MASNGVLEMTQIGYLAANPEFKKTPDGKKVANFVVITNVSWTDKGSEEERERAESIRYEIWGDSAENLSTILQKGHRVFIQSEPRNNEYTDGDGKKVYNMRYVVTRWLTLEKKARDDSQRAA